MLGLHSRFDLGLGTYDFLLKPGSLPQASGRLPHPDGGWISIAWKREGSSIAYSCSSGSPICLRFSNGKTKDIQGGEEAAWEIIS